MKYLVLFFTLFATVAHAHPIDGLYKLVGGRNRQGLQTWKAIDPTQGDSHCYVQKSVLHDPVKAQIITIGKVTETEFEENVYELKVEKGPGPFVYKGTTLNNQGFKFKQTSFVYGYLFKHTEEWQQDAKNPSRAIFEVRDPYSPTQSDCYYER